MEKQSQKETCGCKSCLQRTGGLLWASTGGKRHGRTMKATQASSLCPSLQVTQLHGVPAQSPIGAPTRLREAVSDSPHLAG